MQLRELFERAVSVLYPQRCVLCGAVVAYDEMWCGRCAFSPGGPPVTSGSGFRAGDGFAGVLAAVEYAGCARRAVWRIKDAADPRATRFLAEQMALALREHWGGVPFDLIVPVPASKERVRERGFNHTERLAEQLGQLTGLPVRGDLLLRRDDSRVQHELRVEQRRENAARSYLPGPAAALAAGKTVLLVDDVLTTGATVAACAALLLEAGASGVWGLAAARTFPRYPAGWTGLEPGRPPDSEERRCALAGELPERSTWWREDSDAARALVREMEEALDCLIAEGVGTFVCAPGPGPGVWWCEMIRARQKENPGLRLECAPAFDGEERRWLAGERRDYGDRYRAALETGGREYIPDQSHRRDSRRRRDRYLAESCGRLLAVWDGNPGETGDTVRAAGERKRSCVILNPSDGRL